MTIPLLFEAEAESELDEAAQRYEEHRLGLGQRFLDQVATTAEYIRRFPQAGAPARHVPEDLGVRHAPIKGFPFHFVYLPTGDEIRVLAIAHYRRRPGYWLNR